jgi:hypothetical protein
VKDGHDGGENSRKVPTSHEKPGCPRFASAFWTLTWAHSSPVLAGVGPFNTSHDAPTHSQASLGWTGEGAHPRCPISHAGCRVPHFSRVFCGRSGGVSLPSFELSVQEHCIGSACHSRHVGFGLVSLHASGFEALLRCGRPPFRYLELLSAGVPQVRVRFLDANRGHSSPVLA